MKEILKDVLELAIAGEKSAIKKYEIYMQKALQENLPNVAYLFKALIAAENVHVKNHQQALGSEYTKELAEIESNSTESNSTESNLKDSIKGETWEYKEMYPGFRKKIKREKKERIGKVVDLSFEWASDVEHTHAETLQMALEDVQHGNDFRYSEIYICKVCGNLRFNESEEICPVCKHDGSFYFLIEK